MKFRVTTVGRNLAKYWAWDQFRTARLSTELLKGRTGWN